MTSDQPPPADQDVRERFINELDTSFFLEAGAGSGKTSVIASRVINLVRSGRPLTEIVAITFTEKAAGELRERIRDELAAAGLQHALRDVDAAHIQTIHAFASDILRTRAIDAGLDPDFRVLDQLQADLRFAQSWRTWLWSGAAPQPALQRVLDRGLELGDLQFAAEQMSRNRDLLESPPASEREASPAAPAHAAPASAQRERDDALAELTEALRGLIETDAAERRAEGVLTYDDLLLEARDLLVRSGAARRDLRERYRAILIDEFQDTDPLQAQIALLLASEPDTDDWTQARPGAGRLVIAGDPKQSIYRFRRADIDIYEQVRERFLASPKTCAAASLSVNFRARPQLIAWQNRVLAGLLKADADYPRAQARWEATAPHRTETGVGVAVIPSTRTFDRAGDARAAEAKLVARLITHMQEAASALGQLPHAGRRRAPQYRDIALLVRTRTDANRYTDALDQAGIPYHFDSGQGFYQQPEIRAAAHLLQALDSPTDQAAAVAVLKSPLAAASDDELLQLRRALGRQPIRLDDDLLPDHYEGRLREPIAALSRLRRGLQGRSLPEAIDQVIRASGLLYAQAVSGRPAEMRQRQANLRMLVQRAARFADSHDDSLRPFVRWLSQRGVHNLPESESPTTEADDDAVRMLTIHQAKGLEFPIVIVPKLQDQPAFGRDFIVDRVNQRLEFKLGDDREPFRTPGYAAALLRDRAYADAEARRMLYVAATRARDWLILPSFPAQSIAQRESFHTFLDDAAPEWLTRDADPRAIVLSPETFDVIPAPPAKLQTPPIAELKQAWRERHSAGVAGGARTIRTLTPSQAHQVDWTDEADVEHYDAGRADPPSNPLDFGRAVHEALEAADFNDLELSRERTRRICAKHGLALDPVFAHVERCLRAPLIRQAASSDTVHRELPLTVISTAGESDPETAVAETTITEGVADLLFRDDAGWVLVDYKSDEQIPAARREAYERQLRHYAAMLGAAGIAVAEAYILRTVSGEAESVALSEVPESAE